MIYNYMVNGYSDIAFLMVVFVFFLGASMGSFINVVVDRLIHGQGLGGRSHCDHCKRTLSWMDLIPVISYIVLRGRCRTCHKKLSIEYLWVETATGFLYVGTWLIVPSASLILYWGIVSTAWIIFLSDLRYKLISDYMQYSLFIAVLLLKFFSRATMFSLLADVASGVAVMLPIGLIYLLTNEKAMGQGDVILAAIIGFALGAGKGLMAVYVSFLIGAVVGVLLLVFRKKGIKSTVPFGPFLLIGMLVMGVWGDILIQMIRKFYRL